MKRVITTVVSTLVCSTLIAPAANAIRPELLPKYSQLPEGVEQTRPQAEKDATQNKAEMTQMDAQKPPKSDTYSEQKMEPEDSFSAFERFYRERFGL